MPLKPWEALANTCPVVLCLAPVLLLGSLELSSTVATFPICSSPPSTTSPSSSLVPTAASSISISASCPASTSDSSSSTRFSGSMSSLTSPSSMSSLTSTSSSPSSCSLSRASSSSWVEVVTPLQAATSPLVPTSEAPKNWLLLPTSRLSSPGSITCMLESLSTSPLPLIPCSSSPPMMPPLDT